MSAYSAENGKNALGILQTEGQPSVILLDLVMPVMNGVQFLEEFRKEPKYRDVPVIVVTGQELSKADRQSLNGEVLEIIHKGEHSTRELMEEIQGLMTAASPKQAPPESESESDSGSEKP